jgi:hypothetical protein
VQGLVHLDHSIRKAVGDDKFAALLAAVATAAEAARVAMGEGGGGGAWVHEAFGRRHRGVSGQLLSAVPELAVAEALATEEAGVAALEAKVKVKRRLLQYEADLAKARKMAQALAEGSDTDRMWHYLTRWEGKQDDKYVNSTVPGSARNTAHHNTAQHSAVQCSTVQCSAARHSTAQHSTAQRSAAQCNAAQHRKMHVCWYAGGACGWSQT